MTMFGAPGGGPGIGGHHASTPPACARRPPRTAPAPSPETFRSPVDPRTGRESSRHPGRSPPRCSSCALLRRRRPAQIGGGGQTDAVHLGLFSINMGPCSEPGALAAVARHAEAAGFESVWAGEHVVLPDPQVPPSPMGPQDPALDPLLALDWAAAATSTIRLATGIVILPQRNPVVLAKQLASLDVLSGGRLTFGVGVGYLEPEFRAIGANFEERGAVTDEYLEAIGHLWYDEHPEFHGRFADFAGIDAHPRPVQAAVPVVVGGHRPVAYRRAVQRGHGWYGFALTPDDVAASLAGLAEAAERVERPAALGELEISVTPAGVSTPRRWRRSPRSACTGSCRCPARRPPSTTSGRSSTTPRPSFQPCERLVAMRRRACGGLVTTRSRAPAGGRPTHPMLRLQRSAGNRVATAWVQRLAGDKPTVRRGSTGPPVGELQQSLNQAIGAGLTPDGEFGSLTDGAVRTFQGDRGLTIDGIVGPDTWDAFDPTTRGDRARRARRPTRPTTSASAASRRTPPSRPIASSSTSPRRRSRRQEEPKIAALAATRRTARPPRLVERGGRRQRRPHRASGSTRCRRFSPSTATQAARTGEQRDRRRRRQDRLPARPCRARRPGRWAGPQLVRRPQRRRDVPADDRPASSTVSTPCSARRSTSWRRRARCRRPSAA